MKESFEKKVFRFTSKTQYSKTKVALIMTSQIHQSMKVKYLQEKSHKRAKFTTKKHEKIRERNQGLTNDSKLFKD